MRTATRRRLVLVHEQQEDKGGGPLESIQAECPEGLRQDIFEGRTPITWHRVSHYQNLTLKLIATEMLRQGPKYSSSLSITGEEEPPLTLVLPGEVSASELAMPRPVTLWCSTGNPGAEDFAQELAAAMAGGEQMIRVVTRKPDVKALEGNGESVAMLLYLNKETWVEPNQGKLLERDVRLTNNFAHGFAHELGAGLARVGSNMGVGGLVRMGSNLTEGINKTVGSAGAKKQVVQLVMVHENDPSRGGCDFGAFFGTTPQGLVDEGIYKEIATALHTAPHRAVSLALVAQALGATKGAALALAKRGTASERSSSLPGQRRSSKAAAPGGRWQAGSSKSSSIEVAAVDAATQGVAPVAGAESSGVSMSQV